MNEIEEKFLRIGTQIYRQEINPSGQEQLLPLSTAAIYQDYGKDRGNEIISKMPKYVGWANEPSHTNYQPVIGKWLNLYQPLPHEPRKQALTSQIPGFSCSIFLGSISNLVSIISNYYICSPNRSCQF